MNQFFTDEEGIVRLCVNTENTGFLFVEGS